jgi:TPR repeat/Tetratricopeptide repeat
MADSNRAIKLSPNSALAYTIRGIVKLRKGDLNGATADYNRAIKLSPNNADVYTDRGDVKLLQGDLNGALADYNRAIKLNPNSARAYTNRGNAKRKKGDLDGAMADDNRATKLGVTTVELNAKDTPTGTPTGTPEATPSASPEATTHGPDRNRDLSDILKETSRQENTADTYSSVQWLPSEYWRHTFEDNTRYTPAQIEDAVQTMGRYIVFLVVDAKKGGLSLLSYTPADEIRRTTTLVSPAGDTFIPLEEDALSPGARNLVSVSNPLLANMFGSWGKNINFLVFPGKDKSGAKVVDPLGKGKLTITINSHSFSWHLPLGSLLPPRTCPTCGEQFPGNYEFCPFDGTKLKQ